MIPAFDNFTVAHHKNRFGILNGREPVSNYKTGAAFHQSLHRALDQGLRTGIDRAGRLVENQDIWIGQKRPRDSQELALPLRNVGGILPKLETVSSGELADKFIGAGRLGSLTNFLICCVKPSVADIFQC